jgi:diguanylate cyclase
VYAEIAGAPAMPAPEPGPEASGVTGPAPADSPAEGEGKDKDEGADWSQVIRDLLRQLELRHPGVSLNQKRDGLERLLVGFRHSPRLYDRLAALMKSWGESLPSPAGAVRVEPGEGGVGGPGQGVPADGAGSR